MTSTHHFTSLPTDLITLFAQYLTIPSLINSLSFCNLYFFDLIHKNESFQREYILRVFVRYKGFHASKWNQDSDPLRSKGGEKILSWRQIYREKQQNGRILGLFWSARKGFIYDLHCSLRRIEGYNKSHQIEWHLEFEHLLGGMNLLHEACHYGQLGVVRYLVEEKGLSLTIPTGCFQDSIGSTSFNSGGAGNASTTTPFKPISDQNTCLLLSIGHTSVLEYILSKLTSLSDIMHVNIHGDTAMSLAAQKGNLKGLSLVLNRIRQGASENSHIQLSSYLNSGSDSQNPLCKSVISGNHSIFDFLLTHAREINVNQLDKSGICLLQHACRMQSTQAVSKLLEHNHIRLSLRTLARECVIHDSAPILDLIINTCCTAQRTQCGSRGSQVMDLKLFLVDVFFWCIEFNALLCHSLMLGAHRDVVLNAIHEEHQMTPLIYACVLKRTHIVEILLLMEADESVCETRFHRSPRDVCEFMQLSTALWERQHELPSHKNLSASLWHFPSDPPESSISLNSLCGADIQVKRELNLHFILPFRFPAMNVAGQKKRIVLLGGKEENMLSEYHQALANDLQLKRVIFDFEKLSCASDMSKFFEVMRNLSTQHLIVFLNLPQLLAEGRVHLHTAVLNRFFQFVDEMKHKKLNPDHYLLISFPPAQDESNVVQRVFRERLERREYPVLYVQNPNHEARCEIIQTVLDERTQNMCSNSISEMSRSFEGFSKQIIRQTVQMMMTILDKDKKETHHALQEAVYFVAYRIEHK